MKRKTCLILLVAVGLFLILVVCAGFGVWQVWRLFIMPRWAETVKPQPAIPTAAVATIAPTELPTPTPLPVRSPSLPQIVGREEVSFTTVELKPLVEADPRLDDILTLAIEQEYERVGTGPRLTLSDGFALTGLRLLAEERTGLALWIEAGGKRNVFLVRLLVDGTLIVRDREGWLQLGLGGGDKMQLQVYDWRGSLLWWGPLVQDPKGFVKPFGSWVANQESGWERFVACLRGWPGAPPYGKGCVPTLARIAAECSLAEEDPAKAFASTECLESAMTALVACGPSIYECLWRSRDDLPGADSR